MHPIFTSRSNRCGLLAILCWSLTALIVSYSRGMPPLFLAGSSLLVGFLGFSVLWWHKGIPFRSVFRLPRRAYALGGIGITGYYGFYIAGLRRAPILEANMINYLWPILLVLFSSLLARQRLRWFQITGVALGFIGVIIVIAIHNDNGWFDAFYTGHIYTLIGAVIWAGYSALLKHFRAVPHHALGVFLLIAGTILLLLHLIFEPHHLPQVRDLLVILVCGLVSPLGYYFWDIAMKNGSVPFIAVLSFLTPLLSMTWLVLFGKADMSVDLLIGGIIILSGIIISSMDKLIGTASTTPPSAVS